MYSSPNTHKDVMFSIFMDKRTVFRLNDIAMLTGESNFQSLNKKLNYYVHSGKLLNPRMGLYAKADYNPEELACIMYTPSYISLEYVLQKNGIIFQYDTRLTAISYLSRSIEIDDNTYLFRKIKGEILVNTSGIERKNDVYNIASAERAFLDLLYLNKNYSFDNINPIDKQKVKQLLPIYESKTLSERVKTILQND